MIFFDQKYKSKPFVITVDKKYMVYINSILDLRINKQQKNLF